MTNVSFEEIRTHIGRYNVNCECGRKYSVPHFFFLRDSEGEKECVVYEFLPGERLTSHSCRYISRTTGGEYNWKQGVAFRLPCGCSYKMGKAGVASPYHFIDGNAEKSAYNAALKLV